MTDQPTTLDRLAVVKALARPTAMGLVIASNPHLTKARVEAIAADAGYPKINDLRSALVKLQSQVDQERMGAISTGPTDASRQAGTRNQELGTRPRTMDHGVSKQVSKPLASVERPAQVAQGPQPYEPTAQLLLEARDSASKRTVNLAKKIEDLLVDLRDRLRDESRARRDAQLAAAAKRREAEQREHDRQAALAEVTKAEEALRAAREKARKLTKHGGAGGRAKVLRSPSSESRQPGGRAAAPHLAENRDAGRQYQYDLVARLGCTIADIRTWANEEGLNPGKGSRIARSILDAYETAHPARVAS